MLDASIIQEIWDGHWNGVAERLNESLKRKVNTNRASMIGACARRVYFTRVEPWESIPWYTPGLCRIFEDGNLHETAMVRQLEEAGFKISRQQRIVDNHPELSKCNITGTCDFSIEYPPDPEWLPADCKSLNMMDYQKITDPKILLENHWQKKIYSQGQIYCFGFDKDKFIFPLKGKNDSNVRFLEMPLDMPHVNMLLEKASLINFCVKQKEPPARIPWDEECFHCPFLQHCLPDMHFKSETEFVEETEIINLLDEREKHVEGHRAYGKVHELVKELLKKVNCQPGGAIRVPGYEIKKSSNGAFRIKCIKEVAK